MRSDQNAHPGAGCPVGGNCPGWYFSDTAQGMSETQKLQVAIDEYYAPDADNKRQSIWVFAVGADATAQYIG